MSQNIYMQYNLNMIEHDKTRGCFALTGHILLRNILSVEVEKETNNCEHIYCCICQITETYIVKNECASEC